MSGQIRAKKQTKEHKDEAPVEAKSQKERGDELKDEMDALLDEIDDVLEENAEEFVNSYLQRPGE